MNKGFTLLETILVISIIAIVSVVVTPNILNSIEETRRTADTYTLRVLNNATEMLEITHESDYILFNNSNTSDLSRMISLTESGYLTTQPEPKQNDKNFHWNIENKKWEIQSDDYTIESSDVLIGTGWQSSSILNFFGLNSKDINIPNSINGVVVTQIYQDAANNLGLNSVKFSDNSSITQIHARAFKDNNLSEITFPDSIKRIDYGAFTNNNLTKITIGSGVSIETKAFDPIKINNVTTNNVFNAAYTAGGAGTYILVDENWIKQ